MTSSRLSEFPWMLQASVHNGVCVWLCVCVGGCACVPTRMRVQSSLQHAQRGASQSNPPKGGATRQIGDTDTGVAP